MDFKSQHLRFRFQVCPLYTGNLIPDSQKHSTTTITPILPKDIVTITMQYRILKVIVKPGLGHSSDIHSISIPYTSGIQDQNVRKQAFPVGRNIVGWIGLQGISNSSLLANDGFLEERIREVERKILIRTVPCFIRRAYLRV